MNPDITQLLIRAASENATHVRNPEYWSGTATRKSFNLVFSIEREVATVYPYHKNFLTALLLNPKRKKKKRKHFVKQEERDSLYSYSREQKSVWTGQLLKVLKVQKYSESSPGFEF